jgi:hypothetical protein
MNNELSHSHLTAVCRVLICSPVGLHGVRIRGRLQTLARKIHSWIEQRSGEGVRRLENTEPNENATRRFF